MRASVVALLGWLTLSGAADEPRQISQSGFGAFEVSLTPFDGGFAAAWYDTRDGHTLSG